MLCRTVLLPRKKKTGAAPVYLNVYDLTPINGYAHWLGLGIYHSGVQASVFLFLNSYYFMAEDFYAIDKNGNFMALSMVLEHTTIQAQGFLRWNQGNALVLLILIGRTDLVPKEVRAFMEKLAQEYSGNTYHLITKNCNHFCNDACIKLTGKTIPNWVNRLARLGFICNCVLLVELNQTKIRQVKSENRVQEGEKKTLRSRSSRLSSSSKTSPSLTPCSSASGSRSSRQRYRFPPSIVYGTST